MTIDDEDTSFILLQLWPAIVNIILNVALRKKKLHKKNAHSRGHAFALERFQPFLLVVPRDRVGMVSDNIRSCYS